MIILHKKLYTRTLSCFNLHRWYTNVDIGVTEYLSKKNVLCGHLKQFADDFIVTEISNEGSPRCISRINNFIDVHQLHKRNQFVHFTLLKANRNTNEVLQLLSRACNVSPKIFSMAGLKDRRGVTFQRLAFKQKDLPIETLSQAISSVKWDNANIIGDFEHSNAPLSMGELAGNRFSIIIRNIDCTQEKEGNLVLKEACESIAKMGVINYYGRQRFGTGITTSADVGALLFRRKYEEACKMCIFSMETPDQNANLSRELYLKGDYNGAAKAMPKRMLTEHAISTYLAQSKTQIDFEGAFAQFAPQKRQLFYNGLASLLWNKAITDRIQNFGSHVVEGDLVVEVCSESEYDFNSQSENGSQPNKKSDLSTRDYKKKEKITSAIRKLSKTNIRLANQDEIGLHLSEVHCVMPLPWLGVFFNQTTQREHQVLAWKEDILRIETELENLMLHSKVLQRMQTVYEDVLFNEMKVSRHDLLLAVKNLRVSFRWGATLRRIIMQPKNVKYQIFKSTNPELRDERVNCLIRNSPGVSGVAAAAHLESRQVNPIRVAHACIAASQEKGLTPEDYLQKDESHINWQVKHRKDLLKSQGVLIPNSASEFAADWIIKRGRVVPEVHGTRTVVDLQIQFDLEGGQYATMILRELFKGEKQVQHIEDN